MDGQTLAAAAPMHVVGLDIGGTKMAGALVSFPLGRIVARHIVPTGATRGGDAVLADALTLTRRILAEAHERGVDVGGIGVGVAELVDPAGVIASNQTLDWHGLALAESFAPLAPTVIESDVRAAALAEALFGAGRLFRDVVYVTVGTGISHCLVRDGQPYAGARGNALIFASAPFSVTCTVCGAAQRPVLEEIAAGPALVAHYNRRRPGAAVSARDVTDAAALGDPVAVEVVRGAGEALGVGVGFLVNVLDPEAVIVGGGLGLAGGLYWQCFEPAARRHIWADNTRDLPIMAAALGVDAGVVGAAAAFWARELGAPGCARAVSGSADGQESGATEHKGVGNAPMRV